MEDYIWTYVKILPPIIHDPYNLTCKVNISMRTLITHKFSEPSMG